MSIRIQIGPGRRWSWLSPEDLPGVAAEGQVLQGNASVEAAQDDAVFAAPRPLNAYDSVDEYDAVLRSHCRLDREG